MIEDNKNTALELGLFAQTRPGWRVTVMEVIAAIVTLIWLGMALFFSLSGNGVLRGWFDTVLMALAFLTPIFLIWVTVYIVRTSQNFRAEINRLQSAIDAIRATYVAQQIKATDKTSQSPKTVATPSNISPISPAKPRAPLQTEPAPRSIQPSLGLAIGQKSKPVSVEDFIRAMNFPETEQDAEGFRALRMALQDPKTERLMRAGQDVLTLLSQDGIYMDDFRPDRARPEIWRKFAKGERGPGISAMAGITDQTALDSVARRMKNDPIFRDAVHHFLRHFDRTFTEFEKNASASEVAALAHTRSARAFMLVGRVAGAFD